MLDNFTNLSIDRELEHLIGQKHGHLTIIGVPFTIKKPRNIASHKKSPFGWVVVECDCGNIELRAFKDIYNKTGQYFRSHNRQSSCNICKKYNTKHGFHHLKLYRTWCSMKARVKNPYKHAVYLEKGIKVCEDWINSYENFAKWSIENGYYDQPKDTPFKDRLSLDRKDSDKDYCPENCRWTTVSENSKKVGSSNLGKKSFMRRKIKYLEKLLSESGIIWDNDEDLAARFENDKAQTRRKNQKYKPTAKRESSTL